MIAVGGLAEKTQDYMSRPLYKLLRKLAISSAASGRPWECWELPGGPKDEV